MIIDLFSNLNVSMVIVYIANVSAKNISNNLQALLKKFYEIGWFRVSVIKKNKIWIGASLVTTFKFMYLILAIFKAFGPYAVTASLGV